MRGGGEEFCLPKHSRAYSRQVLDKIKKFISFGFWTGIHLTDIQNWLSNFKDNELDFYFAIRLLDRLMYRSSDHFKLLVEELIINSIPTFLNSKLGRNVDGKEFYLSLKRGENTEKIRFVPVITDEDKPTKSGFYFSRILKKHINCNEDFIILPGDFENKYDSNCFYIICDDFAGTGHQFDEFLYNHPEIYKKISPHKNMLFHPLIIHIDANEYISAKYANIDCRGVEFLDKTHNIFSSNNDTFMDGENNGEVALKYYEQMVDRYQIELNPFGYSRQSLLLAFQDTVPDNSLAILSHHSGNFMPLFKR